MNFYIIHTKDGYMNKLQNGDNMTYAVAINSSGQATIPKAIRELLNIVPGENRLTFDVVKGKVILGREPSRAERLESSMKKIWSRLDKELKTNPEFAKNYEKYKGMGYEEVRATYDASPEGKKEFKEKYGIEI